VLHTVADSSPLTGELAMLGEMSPSEANSLGLSPQPALPPRTLRG
jgi:hypothetical protein